MSFLAIGVPTNSSAEQNNALLLIICFLSVECVLFSWQQKSTLGLYHDHRIDTTTVEQDLMQLQISAILSASLPALLGAVKSLQ